MDLESTNGTLLNGERVEPARYIELKVRERGGGAWDGGKGSSNDHQSKLCYCCCLDSFVQHSCVQKVSHLIHPSTAHVQPMDDEQGKTTYQVRTITKMDS